MGRLRRELLFFAVVGVLFFIATGLDAYNTEQNYYFEDPDRVKPGHLSLDERIGYALIVNADYAKVELVPSAIERDPTPHFQITDRVPPELDCANRHVADLQYRAPEGSQLKNVDSRALLRAILSAETYNRGALSRWIEAVTARASLFATGRIPEISLGLGQIKPSVARKSLPQEQANMTDPELLEFLLNDCSNVFAVSTHMLELLQLQPADRSPGAIVRDVAAQYNGGANGVYVTAVFNAYSLLAIGGVPSSPDMPNAAESTDVLQLCAMFDTGMPTGEFHLVGPRMDEAIGGPWRPVFAAAQRISVALTEWEPGPKTFLDRLAKQRLEWIAKGLRDLGVPGNLQLDHRKAKMDDFCSDGAAFDGEGQGGGGLKPSFGLVSLTLPPGTALPPAPAQPAQ